MDQQADNKPSEATGGAATPEDAKHDKSDHDESHKESAIGANSKDKTGSDTNAESRNKNQLEVNTEKAALDGLRIDANEVKLKVGFTCKNGWYEYRPHGKLPEKRSHHSSVIHNGNLYIYGGEDNREGKYDSLWKLNLDAFIEIGNKVQEEDKNNEDIKNMGAEEDNEEDQRLQWELVKTTGTKPGAISYVKSVVKGDNMYLFGGTKVDGECNGDLYLLNLTTYEWTIDPTQQDKPEPRDDISVTSSDTLMFVYGGFVGGKRMNDLYTYDFEAKSWECLSEYHDVNEFSSEEDQTKYPCPRSGQDIAYYSNKIYMFGGRNDFNDKLNDTWVFDIGARTWSILELQEKPIGRSHHTLVVEGNRMILFGGIIEITKEINEIHQFDFGTKEWTSIDDKSDMDIRSPARANEVKMNETAPVRSQNALKTLDMKRDANNKSMKKIHTKDDLLDPDENDKNFHLLKPVPKHKKKSPNKSKNDNMTEMRNEINTPTTENLRNTFVIKNQNEGFDHYYAQMKKRKGDSIKNKAMFASMFNQCLKPCERPTARDGHSCEVYQNRLYIFGGDRHHMPYNDVYSLDLS